MARRAFGWVLVAVGLAVFAVRFQHAGPYAPPGGGNLRAALLALALGAWLVRDWRPGAGWARPATWLALAAGPVVLFFALYAVLAELEEVVTLRVATVDGERADLRLWIVDRDGAAWATMRGAKAERHGLGEARAELLRGGSFECVVVRRVEDREAVVATHEQRQQKYRVQRLATALGVMPREPSDEMVAVRIEPCPG